MRDDIFGLTLAFIGQFVALRLPVSDAAAVQGVPKNSSHC